MFCKHISRLRNRKGLASKKQAILQNLKDGVLRIDDTGRDNVLRIGGEESRFSTLSESLSKFDEYKPWPHDDTPRKFDDAFYNFIAAGGYYSGCSATVWPNGYTIPFTKYTLHKGLMEDFLLYILNNHSILSCISAMKKSTFSRNKRRIAFTMEHSLAFFLVAFNTSLISVGMSKHLAVILNMFAISPTCSLYNSLFHDLLTCPCIQDPSYRKRNPNVTFLLEYLGVAIALPLMLGGFALLILASFSYTYRI